MAENTKVSTVLHSDKMQDMIITKSLTPRGHLSWIKVALMDYDKNYELIYGSNIDEAFEQLDELIGKLQAIRQDLDVTTKE